MRVVAGKLRGRSLIAPGDQRVRPTSDRVREAVFNMLLHSVPEFSFQDITVLDLFAGTGALGIEALSRGARSCCFVDIDQAACALVRKNIDRLGLADVASVCRCNAVGPGYWQGEASFQLVFVDPPYGKKLGERSLESAVRNGWVTDRCVIVLEERAGAAIDWPMGFEVLIARTWGDTMVSIARYRGIDLTSIDRN